MTDIGEEELLRREVFQPPFPKWMGKIVFHVLLLKEIRQRVNVFISHRPTQRPKIKHPWLFPRVQNYPPSVERRFHMWKVCPAVLVAAHWKPHPSFSVPQMDQIYNSAEPTQKIFGTDPCIILGALLIKRGRSWVKEKVYGRQSNVLYHDRK